MGTEPRVQVSLEFCHSGMLLFWGTYFKDAQSPSVKSLVLQKPRFLTLLPAISDSFGALRRGGTPTLATLLPSGPQRREDFKQPTPELSLPSPPQK